MFLKIIAYALGSGLGYLLAAYLPESPATPYIPLLLSYHIFLLFLVIKAGVLSEQKVGLSMPLPMIFISHCACIAALVGLVMSRHELPAFRLLQYAIPALAPFEVQWLFEGKKAARKAEPEHTPAQPSEYTMEEYNEFLLYLKRSKRKFQAPGQTVQDEFAAWLRHHRKKPVAVPAPEQ